MNGVNDWEATGQKLGNICRSKVWELWRTKELGSIRIGRRRFSTDAQIADYIQRLEQGAPKHPVGGVV